jgi:hypothetical protein
MRPSFAFITPPIRRALHGVMALILMALIPSTAIAIDLVCLRDHLGSPASDPKNSRAVKRKDVEAAKDQIFLSIRDGKPIAPEELRTPAQRLAMIEMTNPFHPVYGKASESLDELNWAKRRKIALALRKMKLNEKGALSNIESLKSLYSILHPPTQLAERWQLQEGLSPAEIQEAYFNAKLSHENLNQALIDQGIISENGKSSRALLGWFKQNANVRQALTRMGLAETSGLGKLSIAKIVKNLSPEQLDQIIDVNFNFSKENASKILGVTNAAELNYIRDVVMSAVNRGVYLCVGSSLIAAWFGNKPPVKKEKPLDAQPLSAIQPSHVTAQDFVDDQIKNSIAVRMAVGSKPIRIRKKGGMLPRLSREAKKI